MTSINEHILEYVSAEVVRLRIANAELLEALEMLAADVRDYPAWQRPCAALDKADAILAKAKGNGAGT